MATIDLNSSYNIDNFWNPGTFISNNGTVYVFSNSGGFVKVTGTGLTDDGSGNPTGGTYTDIAVYSDAGLTVEVGTYHSATAVDFATFFSSGAGTALAGIDTITGSSGADTIIRFGGGDTLDGGDGSDLYNFFGGEANGTTLNDTGSSGADILRPFGNVDFTTAASITGIEELRFSAGTSSATFNASQFGTGLISDSLAVTGSVDGNPKSITINNASNFSAAGWTFTDWETGATR